MGSPYYKYSRGIRPLYRSGSLISCIGNWDLREQAFHKIIWRSVSFEVAVSLEGLGVLGFGNTQMEGMQPTSNSKP